MKYIVVVPDGMADQPLEELGNRTPLEAAHTTNMDYLASHGCCGIVTTIPKGMPPGSDIGNLALLGYDPREHFSGRAPLEAANLKIELAEDQIAVRCNFVTVEKQKMLDYSAGHISTKEASILIEALNDELEDEHVRFYSGKSYRHILVMRVRKIDEFLKIKCTPPHDILGKDITKYLPRGKQSEMLLKLMESSKKILENHSVNTVRIDLKENPANMVWLWGQGVKPNLPLFSEKFGVNGGIISAVDLVNGLGRLAGLEVINVPGITGYYDTNYHGKAEYALKALETKDFVFIHIEAPDEAGHNGDIKAKISAIEHIDREIIGAILNRFNENDDVRILVLPDHPTPVKLRTHTSDPVGFVLFGKGIHPDGSTQYHEKAVKDSKLRFESGEALMNYFIKGNI